MQVKLTTRGRLTLPAAVRLQLGLQAGQQLLVTTVASSD
jgi:AbrB family looped-hinge helix DNA binding protein